MATVAKERHEIPVAYTWDLESIYETDAAWETAVTDLIGHLPQIAAYKGRLHEGASTLAELMEKLEGLQRDLGKIYVYASLAYSTDTTNQAAAASNDRARGVFGQVIAATAFMQPELLEIGFETLQQWKDEEPRLSDLGHYFDRLQKQQEHVRSADIEQIMGMVQDTFSTMTATHSILANADLRFEPAQDAKGEAYDITQGTINGLLTDPDRQLRRTAYENYADGHLAFKNTMANALAAGVKKDVFLSRVRGYDSALEAALSSNFIPKAVFTNLIETYKAHLPTWHKYWAIRRRALGVDQLHPYDERAPLSRKPPVVSFETAVEWIAAGMAPLGARYTEPLKAGALSRRWIDIYPNKGKRMGAFSAGVPGTHPFIMMSYTEDLFGMSTLAHELGHSMHSFFTWQTQSRFAYSRYGLFVAEVASNFNQALVRAHLLETEMDPEFQIAVIEEALANFRRYFFIMPTLARFELEIHERVEKGQALSADTLNALMADLFAEGYGEGITFDRERVGITWAQFHTHMYANFYVYQYATGISAAHALAARILAGETRAADNYLEFLKAGGAVYPLEALQVAGVDMTAPTAVETTFATLAGYVDRLERLIAQR